MSKKPTPARPRSSVDLATLALDVVTSRDRGKEAYANADAQLVQLLRFAKPGTAIPIGSGVTVTIVDNFAKGNKAWKPCGINRYDVKIAGKAKK